MPARKVTHPPSGWFFIFGHSPSLLVRAPRAHLSTCQSLRLFLATCIQAFLSAIVAPLPKGSWHGGARNAVTEGYGYAGLFVFYCILFAFNTSYPPFNVSPPSRKSWRLGHRSGVTYALAHLAAARTAGVRCAMQCLARPPLRQGGARYGDCRQGKEARIKLFPCCRFPAGASARLLNEPC